MMKKACPYLIKVYLLFFTVCMLVFCRHNKTCTVGEWDDYTLPMASLIHDHNFEISDEDIEVYKEVFPEWKENIELCLSLSSYTNRAGTEQLTYYFPTYALVCLPVLGMLHILGKSSILTFPVVNIFFLMVALFYSNIRLQVSTRKKALLALLLTINPVVFYIRWASAEVFLYAMLVMAATCWYNGWKKRAALFVAVAGTLNPTILVIGIVMIMEYMVELFRKKPVNTTWRSFIWSSVPDVFLYGCCYVIGVVPMIYNLYQTGHMNLTAAQSKFTHASESTFSRFLAYLFDLNFGLFPYFSVLLTIATILLVVAIIKKHGKYLTWILAFFLNVYLYSIMVHINSGMSGMARYNVWGSVLLLFAVVLYGDEIIQKDNIKRAFEGALYVGALITGIVIVYLYPTYIDNGLNNRTMTPLAECVLDYTPGLYNPLYSTFAHRSLHSEAGYVIEKNLPVVYTANDGCVRKILACRENMEELREGYTSCNGSDGWFNEQLARLGDEATYISVPRKYQIIHSDMYTLGTTMVFGTKGNTSERYVSRGFSHSEDWGTWTDGHDAFLCFRSTSDCEQYVGSIACQYVFGDQQLLNVYVNDVKVLNQTVSNGETVSFSFDNPGDGELVRVHLELPMAQSMARYGGIDDRVLGLGISQMIFEEAE